MHEIHLDSRSSNMYNLLIKYASENKPLILTAFVCAIACYGFDVFNYSLSIDEEVLAVNDNINAWIAQGRYGIYIIKKLLNLNDLYPFYLPLLSIMTVSLSAIVWCFIFGIVSNGKSDKYGSYIFAILYISCPVLAYYLSFNTFNLPVSIGMLLVALSMIHYASYCVYRKSRVNIVVCSLYVSFAISIYQCMAGLWLSGVILCIIIGLIVPADASNEFYRGFVVRCGICAVLVLGLALSVYLLGAELLYKFVPKSNYTDNFIGWKYNNVFITMISLKAYINSFLYGQAYYGSKWFWLSIPLAVYIALSTFMRSGVTVALIMTVSMILLILSPFLLSFALGTGMPFRSMQAVSLMLSGMFFLALLRAGSKRTRCFIIILGVYIFTQNAQAVNKLYFSDYLRWQADRQLATLILDRIYMQELPENMKSIPVVFVGTHSLEPDRIFVKSETFGASFFEWEGGNSARIVYMLKTLGIQELRVPGQNEYLLALDESKNMPSWPAKGSVKLRDGVIIVKLSEMSDAQLRRANM
jgi:hypothetical protein